MTLSHLYDIQVGACRDKAFKFLSLWGTLLNKLRPSSEDLEYNKNNKLPKSENYTRKEISSLDLRPTQSCSKLDSQFDDKQGLTFMECLRGIASWRWAAIQCGMLAPWMWPKWFFIADKMADVFADWRTEGLKRLHGIFRMLARGRTLNVMMMAIVA